MNKWVLLFIAIISETIATSALKSSDGFSKLLPSLVTIVGYGVAFYCLSLTLRTMPIGVAYAIWSAVGIVLVTLIGVVLYKQVPDTMTIVGLAFIVAGVLIINLLGKSTIH